ncbi:MAG: hypothetical protein COA96_08650 [SAR86 cluster bacterium]|uniref:Uncharacterized protein n=1 Tax=SAR86 cluster bacterium TaxID=2030880 RepID=A0A2A5B046_9GAMM|nr:MAG: hypothetical protein COA96_08650 [SAR86 cluster bacterium]
MISKQKMTSIVVGIIVVITATTYVFMTPYNRIAGIRIGGTLTAPPTDWNSVKGRGIGQLKTGGFPPFVVNMFYATDDGGLITATRPDGGYWSKRARIAPDGYLRVGDETFALTATEIFGDERLPYLEKYGAANRMSMGYDFEGEIIVGASEPLHTWKVFYWTAR